MSNFNLEKNGYNKNEVDTYLHNIVQDFECKLQEQKIRISDLKREMENLNNELGKFKSKNDNISDALVVAVETAKQIEFNSKSMYELEIQRLRNLYSKWELVLTEFIKEYPKLQESFDTSILLKKFSDGIEKVLNENSSNIQKQTSIIPNQSVSLKTLINRMSGGAKTTDSSELKLQIDDININKKNDAKEAVVLRVAKPKEETLINEKLDRNFYEENKRLKSQIKPIINSDTNDKYTNLMDKFLNENLESNAYTKAVFKSTKQNSGFDLKEALNPTEDLEQIMKSFNFYPNNTKDDKQNKENK